MRFIFHLVSYVNFSITLNSGSPTVGRHTVYSYVIREYYFLLLFFYSFEREVLSVSMKRTMFCCFFDLRSLSRLDKTQGLIAGCQIIDIAGDLRYCNPSDIGAVLSW